MEKRSQKPYLPDYNLFIVQDLWQAEKFEGQFTCLGANKIKSQN